MPTLLGPDGQPVRANDLTEEKAGPTTTGIRSIVSGHPWQGLTLARLANLLRDAENGDATRYLELAEEMEEKDLHYRGVLGTRRLQVSSSKSPSRPPTSRPRPGATPGGSKSGWRGNASKRRSSSCWTPSARATPSSRSCGIRPSASGSPGGWSGAIPGGSRSTARTAIP